jgi:hypothetical protein
MNKGTCIMSKKIKLRKQKETRNPYQTMMWSKGHSVETDVKKQQSKKACRDFKKGIKKNVYI